MVPQWIIEKKRDGGELEPGEISAFVSGFAAGTIPDYQMAALAMAVYFRGMTPVETSALTRAMLESGERLDLSSLDLPRVDKHSTGGVGDKVSLVLAPLVACCGVSVPMISGRGLGITGGTLDKMESIPGYRADLSVAEFTAVVRACGCSIMGQTSTLVPADRKLYALRDVTGTVPSIPLITASIMSKKLAESLTGLVMDVKCGAGAFMRTPGEARALAESLMAVGREMGLPMASLVTRMDEPLGRAVGNRPEVAEAVRALRGEGPADLMEVTLALAARMLTVAGIARDEATARDEAARQLRSGAALARFVRMVELHGGRAATLDDPAAFETEGGAAETVESPTDGWVTAVDADAVGRASIVLGAGRTRADEEVDPFAGISALVKTGDAVAKGQSLAILRAADRRRLTEARPMVAQACRIGTDRPAPRGVILSAMAQHAPGAAE